MNDGFTSNEKYILIIFRTIYIQIHIFNVFQVKRDTYIKVHPLLGYTDREICIEAYEINYFSIISKNKKNISNNCHPSVARSSCLYVRSSLLTELVGLANKCCKICLKYK